MTKWSEPDEYNCTGRNAGDYLLMAAKDGWWSVYDAESGKSWLEGEATDLASAQAAADAACATLLREAMADFGLVFVEVAKTSGNIRTLRALASDGLRYEIEHCTDGSMVLPFGWLFVDYPKGKFAASHGWCATEAGAVAEARAHDEQRRGAK